MTSTFHRTDAVARLDGLIRAYEAATVPDVQQLAASPRSFSVRAPRSRAGTGSARQAEPGDGAQRPSGRVAWMRLIVLVTLLVVAGVVAAAVGPPDAQQIRAYVDRAGPAAPAMFVLIYALVTLFPLPKNVFAALAGVLFGLLLGVVVVLFAALLGAAAAFVLSRVLGRAAVERITGARVARVEHVVCPTAVAADDRELRGAP